MADNVFFNVQVLRAVAAAIVAYYHLQAMLAGVHDIVDVHFAAIGVDIFFVISGFVMFISNEKMDKSPVLFMILRILRIVPLYWIATFVLVAFYFVGFRPNGLMIFDFGMLIKSLFFIQSEFENGRHDLILSLGWTLIYELFFYFVFSLTFFLRSPLKSFVAVSVIFAACLMAGVLFPNLPRGVAYFTNPIIVEFLFGAALALVVMAWRDRGVVLGGRAARASAGAILLALGLVLVIEWVFDAVPTTSRAIVWGVPALMIVAGLVCLEYARYALRGRGALLLGAASYALYLFHPVIMQGVVKLFVWFTPVSGSAGALLVAVAALAAAGLGAVIIHLTVETPILEAGRRLTRRMGTFLARPRYGV
ncbi:acyltransferase family protein [Ancylobacter sp.]|uniref:acyltransferase family protein n=1 Tax=Ancylobacter sp. TaxID=1872567 RepID=UPI003D0BDD14